MAYDKVVDSQQLDADLTSVANAIRTRGGTSAQLAFPADFISAVQAIPAGGGQLPAGYTRVDWLQSDGSAYVDSGIVLNDSDFEVTAHAGCWDTIGNTEYPIISNWTSTYNYWNCFFQSATLRWYLAQTATVSGAVPYSMFDVVLRRASGTWSYTVNGVSYTNARTGYNPTANPVTLKLFARGDLNGINSKVRIGRVTIAVAGSLAAEFIPCKNVANVAGFYDIVRGAFYGNSAARGAFTAGPTTIF